MKDRLILYPALLFLFCFNFPPIFLNESANGCINYIIGLIVGICGLFIVLKTVKKKEIEIGLVSITISLCFFIYFVKTCLENDYSVSSIVFLIMLGYFKTLSHNDIRHPFFIFIRASLIVVYIVILFQYFEIIPSYHAKFNVTGVFLNPNNLAIYIGTLLVILTIKTYIDFNKKTSESILNLTLIFTGIICLLFLKCRTVYIVLLLIGVISFRAQISKISKKYYLLIVPMSIALFYWMYQLKSISVGGRLYVWRLSYEIFKENSLFGVGINNFQTSFMGKQAYFFRDKANVLDYGKFAGQIDFAFCDLLQFFIEYGLIIGLLCTSIMVLFNIRFIRYLKLNNKNSLFVSVYGGLGFLILCSFTNYVFYVDQLKFLGLILIAITLLFETDSLISINGRLIKGIVISLSSIILVHSIHILSSYYEYHEFKRKAYLFTDNSSFNGLINLYPLLKNNHRFLFDAAVLTRIVKPNKISESISLLEKSRALYIHRTNTLVLASYYLKNQQVAEAEQMYLFNSFMNAQDSQSVYTLINFYFNTKQKQKFNSIYSKLQKLKNYLSPRQRKNLKLKYIAINS